MKRIVVVSFISILFILLPDTNERDINEVVINKCGFNVTENNSIIAEHDNKCLRVVRTKRIQKKLMIVAHPDDETIWGGGHLLNDDYLVVCVTCGNVSYRDEEFKRVMAITGDEYVFLEYPDLTNGHIDNWDNYYYSIQEDLRNIVDSRYWDSIITHNPDGEYGHIHHQMISTIVTDISSKDKLYYFGKYYIEDELPNMDGLNDDLYNRKMNQLISIYVSQPLAMKRHRHMMKYENFISYDDWKY